MTVYYDEHSDEIKEYSNNNIVNSLAKLLGLLVQKDVISFEEAMYVIQDQDGQMNEKWRTEQVEKQLEKLTFGMLACLKK